MRHGQVCVANHIWRPACTGGKPSKHVQVVLPDGRRQEWRLTSAQDLDKILNVNNLGGGALLNKSTKPPQLVAAIEEIEANQLYHVLPPGHSSPSKSNVTLWLPVDDGHRYIKRILPTVTQAILTNLLATYSVDGVRFADQPEEIAMADITLLEDGAEYFGVSAETSALRSPVGAHSLLSALLIVLASTTSISMLVPIPFAMGACFACGQLSHPTCVCSA